MKKKIAIGILALLLLLLLFSFLQSRNGNPQVESTQTETKQTQSVILGIYTPAVLVQMPGKTTWEIGIEKQEIPVGTKVKTDKTGRGRLIYPNGTETRIDYNSEITLGKFDPSSQGSAEIRVDLKAGRIWSRITKLLGKETYQTQTSTVVATVRGTSYGHYLLTDGGNKIISTENNIEVVCIKDPSSEEIVLDGTKEVFYCNGKKGNLQNITNSDRDEWFIFNNPEEVLGIETGNPFDLAQSFDRPSFVSCVGPDGKISLATKQDCDNLNDFWDHNVPPQTAGNPPMGNNNPAPTPAPLPTVTITKVTEIPCTQSCTGTTTLVVDGTNFTPDARVKLIDSFGNVYSGNYVGYTDPTQIITDFSFLPCAVFDVQVYFPSPDTRTATYIGGFDTTSFCL